MNNSDADTPCIMSATLTGDVSELILQIWRDWASASDVTKLRLADLNWVNFEDERTAFEEYCNYEDNTTEYGFVYWCENLQQLHLVPNLLGNESD